MDDCKYGNWIEHFRLNSPKRTSPLSLWSRAGRTQIFERRKESMYRSERRRYLPRYALVHEEAGYEFLVDTRNLYGLSLITIRKGSRACVVWVDDDEVMVEETDFGSEETAAIRMLARENRDDLQMWFLSIRDDWKRERLERNCLVD